MRFDWKEFWDADNKPVERIIITLAAIGVAALLAWEIMTS